MPQDEREIVPLFALLAQFEERRLAGIGVHQVDDEVVHLFVLGLGASPRDAARLDERARRGERQSALEEQFAAAGRGRGRSAPSAGGPPRVESDDAVRESGGL